MKWTNLTEAQLTRLAECRSKRADIKPIAVAYMLERGYDAESALITTLEHLDANGQFFDLTTTEYRDFIDDLETEIERRRQFI